MTRTEAIAKITTKLTPWSAAVAEQIVDALIALGLLKVETQEQSVRVAAIERLDEVFVSVHVDGWMKHGRLSRGSAIAIVDLLLKSGFKIVRAES